MRDVGLDVEDGRAVEQVHPGKVKYPTLGVDPIDAGSAKADGVGPVRRPGREKTHLLAPAGRHHLAFEFGLPVLAPVGLAVVGVLGSGMGSGS